MSELASTSALNTARHEAEPNALRAVFTAWMGP
jgi:hypothetical protein